MSNLPAKKTTADERLQALARSASNDTLLKYNSGVWTISDVVVPPNTKFILYPDQVTHSWTHFAGGKVVPPEITAIVAEDADGDTELRIVRGQGREDLGELDESLWETDSSGKKRGPFVYGFGLPATNAETGTFVVYKTASVGGMGAIAGQVASYLRNPDLGRPIVTLSTNSYKNKKYGGFTSVLVFLPAGFDKPPPAPVGRPGGDGDGGLRVVGESKAAGRNTDMDDDIPF
jgi:hypothetical protein